MAQDIHSPPTGPLLATATANGRPFFLRAVTYPAFYIWYVFFSTMDVLFTYLILHFEDGRELNAIARWIIEHYNLPGMVAYKFLLVVFVIAACEIVGLRHRDTGQKLARWAVVLSAFPVCFGFAQLLVVALAGDIRVVTPG